MTENKNLNTESGGATAKSLSMPQTHENGVFFSEIGLRVEKVRKNKYVLKSKYGLWEDSTLTGVLVIVEAMFGKKCALMVRQALGE